MALSLRPALAGLFLGATLAAAPALADVFSSQSFSGGTATLDQLPGVNLDAVPGYGNGLTDCVENDMDTSSFSPRGLAPQRSTTCRFGNFSITSSSGGSDGARHRYDTIYGGNPPPWAPSWRP